jgi:hypothetical protein
MSIRTRLTLFLIPFVILIQAQERYTFSGYVYDSENDETIIGASIVLRDSAGVGTVTNNYGFYSITLASGTYAFKCLSLGFDEQELVVNLNQDVKQDFYLTEGITIETIEVFAEEEDKNISSTNMSSVKLPVENIKRIPALFGEIDILKTIQLLPGVLSVGEGSSGFNVRGGSVDQNLVLLDEAVVYNSGHLFGFFSVFNADALKNTTLLKGGMPANYGGRISSVLDVQMKEGNSKYYEVNGGIGLISSRITAEGPIVKEKSSFLVSARRTYMFDIAQPAVDQTDFKGTNYFFYDLNTKINYKLSDKDRFFLSGYFGRDVLKFKVDDRDLSFEMPYGNSTATLRWNHIFNDRLFMNTSMIYNDYDFTFKGAQDDFEFSLFSGIRDWNIKVDLDYYHNLRHSIKAGINYTYHKLTPNRFEGGDDEVEFESFLDPKYGHEVALYFGDEIKISKGVHVNAGLRYSIFVQTGPYDSPVDDRFYKKGEHVVTYSNPEPRLSSRFTINKSTSIKASYTWNYQYLHLVSNSTSSLPADVWVPSTQLVKPQKGIQYALGLFKNFMNNKLEGSVEVYYRDLDNQLDYRDDYVDNASQDVELDFVFGKGEAYGIEFLLRKPRGRLNGWFGLTLAKSDRWFDEIEESRRFPAVYDREVDISLVANYRISEKLDIGTTFVYGSGRPFTPISGIYFIEQQPRLYYGARNSERLEPYHRMDLGLTYTPNPNSTSNFSSTWTFSIYNIYNRKNTLFLDTDFEINETAGYTAAKASKFSIFPMIPSVTWNFRWNSKKRNEK